MHQLRRPIHVSWLIGVLCLGIVIGVISIQYADQTIFYSTSWLLTSTALIGFSFWRRQLWVIGFVFAAGCLLGLWRGSVAQAQLMPYSHLQGVSLHASGVVSEDTDLDKRGNTILRLRDIVIDGRFVDGSIWVSTKTSLDIRRSDRVSVYGKLQEGFGTFAVTIYNARLEKVGRPQPGDVALSIRDWFADAVRQAIPEPEASLGVGYLVGQRRGLPPELEEALRVAGLTHIIVASGYNLTILVRLARRLFEHVSKYLSFLSAATMILLFVGITGLSPSMSRAGLVAGLALLAWYYGRKFHPVILLLLAAAVTLIINPSYGWNDLGWQLSFAAFGGVMILAPLMQAYFFGDKKPGFIRQILGETISAQIATAPILISAFGQLSLVAVFANLLVLPLVPLAMLLTFIAGVGSLLVPYFAGLIGLPAAVLLGYMTGSAAYFASLPWAQAELELSIIGVVVSYLFIIAICFYFRWVTKFNLRSSSIVE